MAYTLRQLIDMIRTVPDARTALQKLNDKVEGLGGGNSGGGGGTPITSTDSLPEGSLNLYFTPQRVRNTSLTGLVTTDNSDVTASDTVLSSIGKLQAKSDGYGDVVTYNIGTSGVAVPVLNGVNIWSEKQTFSGGIDVELAASMVQDGNQSQEAINLYGAKSYDMPTGGYPVNAVVRLDSGDIVKSTVANNTANPNVDMTGWVNLSEHNSLKNRDMAGAHPASAIQDASGISQQSVNNYLKDQEKSLLDFIPIQYHESIRNYEYTVDCFDYIQQAFDWATANNRGLFVPAGGYLEDGGSRTIYLVNNWGADKNLIVRGAGMGLTIFKEGPGKTNRLGRFCKMFYLYYGASSFVGEFGHIKFTDMTFDKNGSSNVAGATLYEYEQAHIIGGAGSGTVNIKSVQFDDIELKDKIGGGINFSSSANVLIQKGIINNIKSTNHPKVSIFGDGTFGLRGDLEFGTSFGTLDINSPECQYAQIEPVIASSSTNQRSANINGGSIDIVEWTDKGNYSFANLVNVNVKRKFLTRGVQCNTTNCTLKITENMTGGILKITGGTILLDYNPTTNAVTPLLHGTATGYTGYAELWLSDLNIQIDSEDSAILPTGYALIGGTVGLIGSRKRFLNNVKFDSRLEGSIDAYGNGDWKIANCDIQGRAIQIAVGGTSTTRGGSVELINNNYLGSGTKVHVFRNNALWELKVYGSYPFTGFWSTTGTTDISGLIKAFPILQNTTQPSSNTFSFKGQIVENPDFSGSGVKSWIKSATGTATFDRVFYNIFGTAAYAGETLAAGTRGVEQTITVTGAVLSDAVQVTLDKTLSGCSIDAYVSAANTVKATIYNPTGASVTVAAGTLKAKIL